MTDTCELSSGELIVEIRTGGTYASLPAKDLKLGQEFVINGTRWQSALRPCVFSSVHVGMHFKRRDTWYEKRDATSASSLAPNAPFGLAAKDRKVFEKAEKVSLLELEDRGPVCLGKQPGEA